MPSMEQAFRDSSKRKVAHVIFDVDGTLVDNLDLIVKSFNLAVAESASREFSKEEAYALFGPTLEEMIADIVPSGNVKVAIERYHAHYKKHFHSFARTYPGINQLIASPQSAGIEISICTGSSQRMTQTTLAESGLRDRFSNVVTADDVSHQKPDPEGLIMAVQMMKAHADQTVYLGDSARDIEASRRAGIGSAAALWGFGTESKLRALRPDFVFRDTSDAVRLLA